MNLKQTMTGSLLTVASLQVVVADMPYKGDGHLMITPDELEWGPVGSMAGDAKIAVIEGASFQLHGTGPWGIEYINPEHDPR